MVSKTKNFCRTYYYRLEHVWAYYHTFFYCLKWKFWKRNEKYIIKKRYIKKFNFKRSKVKSNFENADIVTDIINYQMVSKTEGFLLKILL